MAWETQERGGSYYTRSRRQDGQVVREYIGTGLIGQIAAQLDEYERRQKEEKRLYWKEKKERLEWDAAFLEELEEAAEILVRAELVLAGFRCRKGEWRREREHNT